jgi:hypothetical protein
VPAAGGLFVKLPRHRDDECLMCVCFVPLGVVWMLLLLTATGLLQQRVKART